MAIFEGTLKEFNYYVGPFARNIIQQLTKKSKKGKCCEMCKKTDVELQAAHIHGEERVQVIEKILNDFYKCNNGNYKVDLEEFLEKFKQFHLPIENHFKFLCEPCHQKYDLRSRISDIEKVKVYLNSLSPEKRKNFLQEMGLAEI